MLSRCLIFLVAFALVVVDARDARAGDDLHLGHSEDAHDPHHGGLFFSNLLVAETPSPHTEARFKYEFEHSSGADAHTFEVGLEFALARWVSVEVEVPYLVLDEQGRHPSHFDNIGLALKLASFACEDRGILLGGGVEVELPTGDDAKGIGSSHQGLIEPFLNAAIKRGQFEAISHLGFAVPFNERSGDEAAVDLALGYNLALVWHAHERISLLLEFDGEAVVLGDEDTTTLNITPGVKFRPFESDIEIGVGVGFPLTHDKEFDVRIIFALFAHF